MATYVRSVHARCINVRTYVHVCMYVCVYVRVYLCMYVCMSHASVNFVVVLIQCKCVQQGEHVSAAVRMYVFTVCLSFTAN